MESLYQEGGPVHKPYRLLYMHSMWETKMMTTKQFQDMRDKIDWEGGFDATFVDYSQFEEIKDEEFHRYRKAYLKAYTDLYGYLYDE